MKKSPPTLILFYVLLGYVVVQFLWWGYLLYELNAEVLRVTAIHLNTDLDSELRKKMFMVLGEGTVFFTLLLIGAFYIRKFLLREQGLARQEHNFLLATTHEFNSPIAAIKLNFQTLNRPEITNEQRAMMTNSGIANVRRLEGLVSNILMASRIDAGKLHMYAELVEFDELVQSVLKRYEGLIRESGIMLNTDFQVETKLKVDRNAIEMVLENLIQNAIKYAPNAQLNVSVFENESSIDIVVADLGIGVSEDGMKRIFQKFYREQNEETRSQKGTGLGLYLVYELVRLHGGRVRAENNVPNGLKVIIQLPKKS